MDPGRHLGLGHRLQALASALATPEAPLEEMALAVSSVVQPGLDPSESLRMLDELAEACPEPTRDGVMAYLFSDGLFRGDRESYHRWRNSCIDQVLTRRVGMPITLSIVGIAVASRVGVELVGVGMPGHFLIGDDSDSGWFADPFGGRAGLGREECRRIYSELGGQQWSDSFLDAVPDRQVIARVLNNLLASSKMDRDRQRLALVMRARQTMPEFASEARAARMAAAVFN